MKSDKNKTAKGFKRSKCPVSCILEIIGDKWTMLVIRDLFFDKHTFKELQASPENIPTNILADRLKRLENNDLIRKELYQEKPKRYAYYLTDKGMDLLPIMQSMMDWSNKHIPDANKVENILKN